MSRLSLACAVCLLTALLAGSVVAQTAAPARNAAPAPPAAAPPTPSSGNLLGNPGFENPLPGHPWMPADWDTSDSGLPTVFFGRDTFLVHGGTYAVNVANTSTLYPMWHNWSQTVLVGPEAWGKDVVFSVWTRSNGLQGRAYVLLQAYRDTVGKMARVWGLERDLAAKRLTINKVDDPLVDFGWKRVYFSEPETEWVRREMRVYVPASTNVIYVRCGLLGTGQVIFDDASLTLEPARPAPAVEAGKNLLADPGFEGDGNAWEYAMPPYLGMRIDRDTTRAHSGKACARFHCEGDGLVKMRTGVCQAFGGRALQGKRLRLSAWVSTDSLKELAFIRLYCHSLSRGVLQSEPSQAFSLTTAWTPISVEMDVPPDAYEVWAWLAYNAPGAGYAYFDDASLEVVEPARSGQPPPPNK